MISIFQGRGVSQHRRRVSNLLESEEKKREKLKDLGVDYDFPGYKAALRDTSQHRLPEHVHFQDAE